jgi:hypothetical protein
MKLKIKMKIKYLLYLPLVAFGCTSTTVEKVVDSRPLLELSLIKKLSLSDSIYQSQINDIKKDEALSNGKRTITKFIVDTLRFQVNDWHAFIHEINVREWNGEKFIDVELLIPKGIELESDYPQYNSCGVPYIKNKVKDTLSGLNSGDKVIVTGTFMPDENTRQIDFTGNEGNEAQYTFINAKFNFLITDIKKAK